MPEVRVEVRRLLEGKLRTLGGLPPVQWENREDFAKPDGLYLRPTLQFAGSRGISVCADGVGEEAETVGLFLVDIFAPPGNGPYEADDIAGRIARLFSPRQGRLVGSGVSVRLGIPYARGGGPAGVEEQSPAYMVPVTVPFFAYHPG
jgi:hypothetical protein